MESVVGEFAPSSAASVRLITTRNLEKPMSDSSPNRLPTKLLVSSMEDAGR